MWLLSHKIGNSYIVENELTNEDLIADAIRNPSKYGLRACILCGAHPNFVAVFTPNEAFAKRIGQPKKKERRVVYAICERCRERPDTAERVEREILTKLGVH